MLKRIASTGVNLVVLGVLVGIFMVAFIALNAVGAAKKPHTISVLSATRQLNIGDSQKPAPVCLQQLPNIKNESLDHCSIE